MLVPPNNFGMVEEDLYRSGAPDQINFGFLEQLNLRSLIWLAPEDVGSELCVDGTAYMRRSHPMFFNSY